MADPPKHFFKLIPPPFKHNLTPPTTPLFPSLEMETRNNHELVIQSELPIIQPVSWGGIVSDEAVKKSDDVKVVSTTQYDTTVVSSEHAPLLPLELAYDIGKSLGRVQSCE
ncbi:hypothetical protein Ccrd_015130 [Cynara cardunculus var. scolymus]|uniref:Uncharacterized protein n=1 Tax=Cynara cardunculus var. scolymus TaxID=59895 RepID=A0A103YCF3_CYNCS|nr:hypothetical protein Ccrd_015130 [Cynara cardunculus var. scolymus]